MVEAGVRQSVAAAGHRELQAEDRSPDAAEEIEPNGVGPAFSERPFHLAGRKYPGN